MSQDDELAEFLEIFREESLERLGNAGRALERVRAGEAPGPWFDELDRELHTIKGSARLLGFLALGALVHELEGLARALRDAPARGLDLLVEATDRLAALVEAAGAGGEDQADEALLARIRAALAGGPDPGGGPASPSQATRTEDAPAPSGAEGAPTGTAPAVDEAGALEPAPEGGGARAAASAAEAGEPASAAPAARAEAPPSEGARQAAPPSEGARPAAPAPPEPRGAGGKGNPRDEDQVRVRASRLQALDGIVSDLSLTRLRLAGHEERLRRLLHSVEEGTAGATEVCQTLRHLLHEYRGDTLQVHRATQQLQQLAIDVRLRPVDHLFSLVPREARDLARLLGKRVQVRVLGAETELDRVILEQLKSPLSHLIRNAVDHGLEDPDARARAGKPPEGTLTVWAGQEGGQVAIHVDDDGAGIDPARIRRLAVERGVIDAALAAQLDDEEAVQLIFVPGFSTRSEASEISGRGVGMDVVRSAVEALKGDVRVHSTPGRGTRTTIRLPLTLVISRVTFVRSAGQQFALPTEAVEESLRLPVERVADFDGAPNVVLDGQGVPLVRLARLLGQRELPDGAHLRVLVLGHSDDRLALAVEELLEERSVVVKPLGWPLERVRFMSGAIHLPSGEVALLLHVPDLFASARHRGAEERHRPLRPDARRTVLVVDDSIVSRQMVSRCVEALGFDLLTATDGMDALRILERVEPDLIVSDVEMPRLDGLGLARRVRADARLAGTPIIIVSSRGSEVDRRAGLEAGADAYLPKGEFNETTFRIMVDRLL